jgi:hypothetical protein
MGPSQVSTQDVTAAGLNPEASCEFRGEWTVIRHHGNSDPREDVHMPRDAGGSSYPSIALHIVRVLWVHAN